MWKVLWNVSLKFKEVDSLKNRVIFLLDYSLTDTHNNNNYNDIIIIVLIFF